MGRVPGHGTRRATGRLRDPSPENRLSPYLQFAWGGGLSTYDRDGPMLNLTQSRDMESSRHCVADGQGSPIELLILSSFVFNPFSNTCVGRLR